MKTAHKRPAGSVKNAVRGKLVRIGKSWGVRLPETMIEQARLISNVENSVHDNQIIIRCAGGNLPRVGWEAQIRKALSEHGEDADVEWLSAPLARHSRSVG
jgi:antitoxin component of MazEF toxin-antitoxin module